MSAQYNLAFYKQVSIIALSPCGIISVFQKFDSPFNIVLVQNCGGSPNGLSPIQSANELENSSSPKWLQPSLQQVKKHGAIFCDCCLLNYMFSLCLQFFCSCFEIDRGISFQVTAREQGQYVAPDQQIRMTSATMLRNFRDRISASASVVAAAAVSGAANSMQQLQVSSAARATITAASAAQARQERILKLREQRQGQGSQAAAEAAQSTLQMSKATQRGGLGTQKTCRACKLHKTSATGHTSNSCPTHCLKCRQPWQTAEKSCNCQQN